jgi:hypothetical protein
MRKLEHGLRAVLWELRDYLPELVLIGGWVPHLHRRYGPFPEWRGSLSFTAELDILVPCRLPRGERPPLRDVLVAAGFEQAPGSEVKAVWARAPDRGEKIEFLAPAVMLRRKGQTVPVQGQPGLAAIPLADIDFLARHTTELGVPVLAHDGQRSLQVRVPRLGAYVINKACTFSRRGSPGDPAELPKAGKDLLYLHDLMAAGPEVVAHIEREIKAIAEPGHADAGQARTAANLLDLTLRAGSASRTVQAAASLLMERADAPSAGAALEQVRGYLPDLLEILSD